ncbi:MAG: hypothetical protein H7Y00_15615 [Fimbriimonadaceae bacterium]|nr:hypothetical protein [Chitinophagales bacterium]
MKTITHFTILFILMFYFGQASGQSNRNTSRSNDNLHPAPELLSADITNHKANLYMSENKNAVYDIITCKNIYTHSEREITQAASKIIILNNLEENSYYEITVKRYYKDGITSKELSFCFNTEKVIKIEQGDAELGIDFTKK